MITYSVIMSNGQLLDIKSSNAANAIQSALEQSPGRTVKRCFSGRVSTIGLPKSLPGTIEYDVPDHNPLPKDWEKLKREKPIDDALAMFNTKEIEAESVKAKEKSAKP